MPELSDTQRNPVDSFYRPEYLLIRRPLCAIALYGSIRKSEETDLLETLAGRMDAEDAELALCELRDQGLITDEGVITEAGQAALGALEAVGFAPLPLEAFGN